jgi:hypothetical protein
MGIAIGLQLYTGSFSSTTNSQALASLPQCHKIDTDSALAGIVRNDLYVILQDSEFLQGYKTAAKNNQVKVSVWDSVTGTQLEIVTRGVGPMAKACPFYTSMVYYHENNAKYDDRITLRLPNDATQLKNLYLLFEVGHCKSSDPEAGVFAVAFLPLWNKSCDTIINDQVRDMRRFAPLCFLCERLTVF